MRDAMLRLREQGVRHFGFGDIFLKDLRAYREQNLARLDLGAVFPLWNVATRGLAARFIRDGFRAFTACIDPRKLDSAFAGRELTPEFFRDLPVSVDPCGENGEFHTFVFNGPIFRFSIPVRPGEVVERDSFVFCDLLPEPQGEDPCLEK
jgi:diphthamide synthase (EF-2-diphthine--ammonia ligase)